MDAARGLARFDGLLTVAFTPHPGLEAERDSVLAAFLAASPVRFQVQREAGTVTLLPDTSPVVFDAAHRPAPRLLAALRDLLLSLGPEGEWRAESTLRVQEFLGDKVLEGLFVLEEPEGMTLAARERKARPGEGPEAPPSGIAERAESFARRYRWPLVGAAAVVAVLLVLALRSGIFGVGASFAEGPRIDAGPLAGIVEFKRVRGTSGVLTFFLRPGAKFADFAEAAKGCDLAPGVFRVLLKRDGSLSGPVLALDLSGLPGRVEGLRADDEISIDVPYAGGGFDEVVLCR